MSFFDMVREQDPEEFYVVQRREAGLTAFLCLDNTRLGPAAGGIRLREYATPEDGVRDVLALSRAMTLKNSLAELGMGGGKTVVLRDPALVPERAFPALGELIESLGGRYITACDYGTTARELEMVKSRTSFALAEEMGGALDMGTATGVLSAMRALWRRLEGKDRLDGARVIVQGAGDVGFILVRLLRDEGARVSFAEIDEGRAERCAGELGVPRVEAAAVFDIETDLLSPCAGGEVITQDVAARVKARGIAGAANNQLATERAGAILQERGILYAPDFAANAGAVIVGFESGVGRAKGALEVVRRIEGRVEHILQHAEKNGITPREAAQRLAWERIERGG